MKAKRKRIMALMLLLLIIAIVIFAVKGRDKGSSFMGIVEGAVISHPAQVSGELILVNAELGQVVKEGDILAQIDHTELKYQLEQMKLNLVKKQLALETIQKGADKEVIQNAKNNVSIAQTSYDSAKASYDKLLRDYEKAEALYLEGAIAQNALDASKFALDSAGYSVSMAKDQLSNAGEALSLIGKGASASDIAFAQTDIEQIQLQIQQMEEDLSKYLLKAACDGVVMSKNYENGAMVMSGYNIVDISKNHEKYLIIYVPKDHINQLEYNQEVSVSQKETKINGVIKFIDIKAQYTPKDLQTSANKGQESVKVKILLEEKATLKPGEKAKVIL